MKKITILFIIAFISHQFMMAQVRIVKADPVSNKITLKNFGVSDVDITGNRLCAKFSYTGIAAGIVDTGDLNLSQNEEVILTWTIDAAGSDLGYYAPTGSFGVDTNMLDFTQWGTPGNGRESVAVSKGIWSTGDFVVVGSPYSYTGDGSQNGLNFWENSLSIEGFESLNSFSLSPNPAKSQMTIKLPVFKEDAKVEVYSVLGKRIFTQELNSLLETINVSQWNSGIYLVRVTTKDTSLTKRFVKQ